MYYNIPTSYYNRHTLSNPICDVIVERSYQTLYVTKPSNVALSNDITAVLLHLQPVLKRYREQKESEYIQEKNGARPVPTPPTTGPEGSSLLHLPQIPDHLKEKQVWFLFFILFQRSRNEDRVSGFLNYTGGPKSHDHLPDDVMSLIYLYIHIKE